MGTLDFEGNFTPRNQLTTKTRFWVQRAPSQSLPGKLEVRSGNKKERKKARFGWTFHPTPKRLPFTYTFHFMHVGCGHRRNHPCQVSSQSVQQFRLPRGSKFTISHRLGEWLLQQCYAVTCYTVIGGGPVRSIKCWVAKSQNLMVKLAKRTQAIVWYVRRRCNLIPYFVFPKRLFRIHYYYATFRQLS